jgi:glycosyltransferase involved in cell wall biosynthesis
LNVSAEYDDSILLKYIIAPKLYIYTISGSSPHKNLAVLIRAFNLFLQKRKDIEIRLVVSGVPNPLEYLKANKLEPENIIFTDYISNQGKNSLLRNCRIFMFLSKEEGFGMPPAEAAFNYCNILLSDIPILRELYNDCAHFTSLNDINIISDDINTYWDYVPDYNKDQCISKFNWNSDARIMLGKFNELIKG